MPGITALTPRARQLDLLAAGSRRSAARSRSSSSVVQRAAVRANDVVRGCSSRCGRRPARRRARRRGRRRPRRPGSWRACRRRRSARACRRYRKERDSHHVGTSAEASCNTIGQEGSSMKLSNVSVTAVALAMRARSCWRRQPAARRQSAERPAGGASARGHQGRRHHRHGRLRRAHSRAPARSSTFTVTRRGLKPGMHGVHLHAVGKCEPDFAARRRPFRSGPRRQPRSRRQPPVPHGRHPELRSAPTARAR